MFHLMFPFIFLLVIDYLGKSKFIDFYSSFNLKYHQFVNIEPEVQLFKVKDF